MLLTHLNVPRLRALTGVVLDDLANPVWTAIFRAVEAHNLRVYNRFYPGEVVQRMPSVGELLRVHTSAALVGILGHLSTSLSHIMRKACYEYFTGSQQYSLRRTTRCRASRDLKSANSSYSHAKRVWFLSATASRFSPLVRLFIVLQCLQSVACNKLVYS